MRGRPAPKRSGGTQWRFTRHAESLAQAAAQKPGATWCLNPPGINALERRRSDEVSLHRLAGELLPGRLSRADRSVADARAERALYKPRYNDFIVCDPTAEQVKALIGTLPGGLSNQAGAPFGPAGVGLIIDQSLRNTESQAGPRCRSQCRLRLGSRPRGEIAADWRGELSREQPAARRRRARSAACRNDLPSTALAGTDRHGMGRKRRKLRIGRGRLRISSSA